jgi:hypothetical protein
MTPSIPAVRADAEKQPIAHPDAQGSPTCPKCSGRMWDNRASKRNPRAPDFKCRNRACDGVLWPSEHRVASPVIQPARLVIARDETAPVAGAECTPIDSLSTLRNKYLELSDFVLRSVRPKYQEQGLECASETVAAIAATLFIAETRREGL